MRTDIHAHYCQACLGYSACSGPYPGNPLMHGTWLAECLLTEPCTACGITLEGTEPVPVSKLTVH
jgi:hypothetical protein